MPADVLSKDFRLSPPVVKDITARKADRGTRIDVSFAPDRRLGRTLTLAPGKQSIVLHDDGADGDDKAGDGIFVCTLPIAFESVAAGQREMIAALQKRGIEFAPKFKGREQVGQTAIQSFLPEGGVFKILPPRIMGSLVDATRSLLVTDASVIRDPARTFDGCETSVAGNPNGVWTFKHLFEEMANQPVSGLEPEAVAREWFRQWTGAFAPGRADSLWPPSRDLAHAPFRLVAIVNRIDLASNPSGYGGGIGGGGAEGRFVFQLCSSGPPRMVIVEYGIPAATCDSIRIWALDWVALGSLTIGSVEYNQALADLTESFVRRGAAPDKPNQSALNQIRADAFIQSLHSGGSSSESWSLLEWQVRRTGEGPSASPIAQTPLPSFNGTASLGQWINSQEFQILTGVHTVGEFFVPIDGTRLFRGDSVVSFINTAGSITTSSHWHAPGIASNQARQLFSLATCDGCHTGETGTNFRHLGVGIPPSGFLTGIDVPDPVVPTTTRHFNDLARRAETLAELASAFCTVRVPDRLIRLPFFDPTIGEVGLPFPPIRYEPLISVH